MLLSIVMPVYNGENTLREAVDSLLAQSVPDWELIIVDDCSSDGSLRLAEEYRNRDGRIRVVANPENMGPAAARNCGIDMATGDYVGFLDCDDTLHEDFVGRMTGAAAEYDADVVWCQYVTRYYRDDAGLAVGNEVPANTVLGSEQAVRLFFKDTLGAGSCCNKIYSRRLFAPPYGLRLNPQRVRAEDWEFNIYAFRVLDRLVVLNEFLYNYYHVNRHSVMSEFRKRDYELMWDSIKLLEDVDEEMNLGKTFGDIINIHGESIIEFVYKGVNNLTYGEMSAILRERRFRSYIENVATENFAVTYRVLAGLLKRKLYGTAFLFGRITNALRS